LEERHSKFCGEKTFDEYREELQSSGIIRRVGHSDMQKIRIILYFSEKIMSDFNETKFSRQILEKKPHAKFHKHPSKVSRNFRQTDKHDAANSRFAQVCERA